MRIGCIGLLLLLTAITLAQGKYDANWCFGDRAGINFSDTAHPKNFETFCDNQMSAASISDSIGNLLFYIAPDTPFTPGHSFYTNNAIYNGSNDVLADGDSLYVRDELTGSIFIPKPGEQDSKYYLFTIREYTYDSLYYCEINKDSNGYIVMNENQLLSNIVVEWGIAAVKHANGNDWWLLFHAENTDTGTDVFYEFLITDSNILGPYIQQIGSLHTSSFSRFWNEMRFSERGNKLAVTICQQNTADLFDFDRCTGKLSNYIPLTNIVSSGKAEITGCEFSADESKLYLIAGGGDNNVGNGIFQYSLDASNIDSSRTIIYQDSSGLSHNFCFGSSNLAPNDKIYIAAEDYCEYPYDNNYDSVSSYLSVINQPDSFGMKCSFKLFSYYLDSGRVYYALPNIPNYNLAALSIYQGTGKDTTICNTDSITIGNPPVANVTYAWQPAVGITDTTLSQQTVKPDSSTWYYVTLTDTTINYSCQSVTDSFFVQVVNCCDSVLLAQCTLSKDTFICTNIDTPTKGAILLVDTVPGVSFVWQPAAGISVHSTQQIVDPSQSTWYYVTFFSDTDSASACNQRKDSVYVEVKKCMVGIDEINSASQHLNIYPNPAQNIAVVEWQPVDGQLELSVTDLLGRELSSIKVDGMNGKIEIDISDLANGMYVVRLLSPAGGGVGGGSAKLTVIK